VLLLLLACISSPEAGFRLEPEIIHADGRSASIDDRDALLDLALADGAEKRRRFDSLTVGPDVTADSLAKTVHWLLYAGSQAPIEVQKGRFLANTYLESTCHVPVLVVEPERVMHLRIIDAPRGHVEPRSLEALTLQSDVVCGPIERQPDDCSRGLLVVDPKTRWRTLAKHVNADWSLFAMPVPEALACKTPDNE
jgi:hypothetical protein